MEQPLVLEVRPTIFVHFDEIKLIKGDYSYETSTKTYYIEVWLKENKVITSNGFATEKEMTEALATFVNQWQAWLKRTIPSEPFRSSPEQSPAFARACELYRQVDSAGPMVLTTTGEGPHPVVSATFLHLKDAHAFVDLLRVMRAVLGVSQTPEE